MRILMVHNRYQLAGGEDVSTAMQVSLLRDAGHHVELIEDDNERIEDRGRLRTAVGAVWSRESYRRISEVLEHDRWDVMHVENFFPLISPSIHYAAARRGVPVVQSLRNFRLLCPQPMLFRDGEICELCVGKRVAWPGVRYGCYRSSRAGTAAIAIMSAGHAAAGTWRRRVAQYVAPSEFARSMFLAAGWDGARISVIPNFVHPDPTPGTGAGGYALFVGRLSEPKGIPLLLAAWSTVDLGIALKIVGDGPMRQAVAAAAREHPQIELLGPQPLDETFALMGDAAFVVAPSQVYETFGRVVVEAAAKGTPAIASDLGGLSEVVDDGVTGRLFAAGSVPDLVESIRRLSADGSGLASMRRAARQRFVERYNGDSSRQRLLGVYHDVCAPSAG